MYHSTAIVHDLAAARGHSIGKERTQRNPFSALQSCARKVDSIATVTVRIFAVHLSEPRGFDVEFLPSIMQTYSFGSEEGPCVICIETPFTFF